MIWIYNTSFIYIFLLIVIIALFYKKMYDRREQIYMCISFLYTYYYNKYLKIFLLFSTLIKLFLSCKLKIKKINNNDTMFCFTSLHFNKIPITNLIIIVIHWYLISICIYYISNMYNFKKSINKTLR